MVDIIKKVYKKVKALMPFIKDIITILVSIKTLLK